MRFWTACDEPLPTAIRMITEATPISMPRMVSPERSLLALSPAKREPDALGTDHAATSAMDGAATVAALVGDDAAVAQPDHALGRARRRRPRG